MAVADTLPRRSGRPHLPRFPAHRTTALTDGRLAAATPVHTRIQKLIVARVRVDSGDLVSTGDGRMSTQSAGDQDGCAGGLVIGAAAVPGVLPLVLVATQLSSPPGWP